MKRLALAVLFAAGACTAQPRSASYFEAHPEEGHKVVRDCARGVHRGQECETALAAKTAHEARARLGLFRKGFE